MTTPLTLSPGERVTARALLIGEIVIAAYQIFAVHQ
jgi:hypothetical protein